MNHTTMQYEQACAPLTAVLDAVPAHHWSEPSPCQGWSARDVLRHMIDTQREFLTGQRIDLGEPPDIEADPAAAWRAHARRVVEAIADDAVPAIAYDGHFGPTTVGATLERFYMWDMLVHRWDIAYAVGADTGFTDAELDQIDRGAAGFGQSLHMDGVCKPALEPPADADRTVRLLARLGRKA